jgi:ribosomal protein RSM22 (predicted rRNA methylase)
VDLRTVPKLDPHELVVCSYVLNELNGLEQFRVLDAAWAAASRALLVVEPGTPEGFARIREMRRWLVEAGAAIAAPCPHDQQCPMEVPDWCHFAVRVERTRLHRLAKGGELGFEDEKFSYVLAVRVPSGSRAPRILRHPRVEAGRIQLSLCGSEGLTSLTVTKRDKVAWRAARKASWGGAWESARGDGAQDE